MMMLMHTVFVSSLILMQGGGTLNECTSPRDIAVGIKLKREYSFSFVVECLSRIEDEKILQYTMMSLSCCCCIEQTTGRNVFCCCIALYRQVECMHSQQHYNISSSLSTTTSSIQFTLETCNNRQITNNSQIFFHYFHIFLYFSLSFLSINSGCFRLSPRHHLISFRIQARS